MIRQRLQRLLWHGLAMAVAVLAAYYAAFQLRFAGRYEPTAWAVFGDTAALVVALRLSVMFGLGQRRAWSRYFSFHDLLQLVRVVTAGTIGLTLVDALLLPGLTIPRGVLLLDWGTSLLALAAISSVPRLANDASWNPFKKPAGSASLIVGATHGGEGLLRAIRRNPNLAYRPVGIVDNRPNYLGQQIAGVPVLGALKDIPRLAARHGLEQVLIVAGELSGKEVRDLVDESRDNEFMVRVVPSYEQLLREDVAIHPREVAITDLLRRPPVTLDNDAIGEWVRGRTVMVTGSSGSIGSEIARQLMKLGPAGLVLVDRSETGQFFLDRELQRLGSADAEARVAHRVVLADLTDRDRVDAVFEMHRPDIVFHAAAYKHVPLMESHPGEAVKNIVYATRNVADLAEKHGAHGLVMISTDKAVNPTSVMGACKRMAERYVQAKAASSRCRMVTVRFGNVLDSAGSVVPLFRQQIAAGGPLTVTHPDMVRYFMLIPEAAQLVIQAGAMGDGGEVFVLDMGEPVRLMDLARDMIRLSGLREGEDIEIKITGMRPGEKLYEELYGEQEQHLPTGHEKIRAATSAPANLLEVLAQTNRLIDLANEPGDEVKRALAEMAPGYQPQKVQPLRARSRQAA